MDTRKFAIFSSIVALGLLLAGNGCDLFDDKSEEESAGMLTVLLTDAQFPVDFIDQAIIKVDSLDIRQKGVETDTGAYITLARDLGDFDLMNFRNGFTATLAVLDIPEGEYSRIRLFADSAKVILIDERQFPMKVPSGRQTGLKVDFRPDIVVESGVPTKLLLDFDMSKSFIAKGNLETVSGINSFSIKPVIRGVNLATAGRLQGTVLDVSEAPILAAQVSISTPDSVLSNTFTDTTGAYAFLGIPVGVYKVEAAAAGFLTKVFPDVAVDDEPGPTVQNFTLLPE